MSLEAAFLEASFPEDAGIRSLRILNPRTHCYMPNAAAYRKEVAQEIRTELTEAIEQHQKALRREIWAKAKSHEKGKRYMPTSTAIAWARRINRLEHELAEVFS